MTFSFLFFTRLGANKRKNKKFFSEKWPHTKCDSLYRPHTATLNTIRSSCDVNWRFQVTHLFVLFSVVYKKKYDDINNDPFLSRWLFLNVSYYLHACLYVYLPSKHNSLDIPAAANHFQQFELIVYGFIFEKEMKQQQTITQVKKIFLSQVRDWKNDVCAMAINNRRRSAYTHRCFVFCWVLFISSLLYKYTTKNHNGSMYIILSLKRAIYRREIDRYNNNERNNPNDHIQLG